MFFYDVSFLGGQIASTAGAVVTYVSAVRHDDRLDITWHAFLHGDRMVFLAIKDSDVKNILAGEDDDLVPIIDTQ